MEIFCRSHRQSSSACLCSKAGDLYRLVHDLLGSTSVAGRRLSHGFFRELAFNATLVALESVTLRSRGDYLAFGAGTDTGKTSQASKNVL